MRKGVKRRRYKYFKQFLSLLSAPVNKDKTPTLNLKLELDRAHTQSAC